MVSSTFDRMYVRIHRRLFFVPVASNNEKVLVILSQRRVMNQRTFQSTDYVLVLSLLKFGKIETSFLLMFNIFTQDTRNSPA